MATHPETEKEITRPQRAVGGGSDLSALSTTELLQRIAEEVKELVKTELELAKMELKADLRAEAAAAKGLGVGALLGYAGLILLLVTAALALGMVMRPWAAGLLVAGVALAGAGVAGMFGWSKRVQTPLGRTRRQLSETLQWAKGRTR